MEERENVDGGLNWKFQSNLVFSLKISPLEEKYWIKRKIRLCVFNPQHKKNYTLLTKEKMNVNKMLKSLQYINVEQIIKKDKKIP